MKAAVGGIGLWGAAGATPARSRSPSERVRFASIGVDGKGASDSADAGNSGEMVAICDVDEGRLDGAAKRFPKAAKYTDFRKMLEVEEKRIDAVTVSTPDHCHAVAAVMAMKMGKHCFVQAPLSHTIQEARVMGEVARQMKVATQMGNQFTAYPPLRKAAALVRAGMVGTVKEVHVWTSRPLWAQGFQRPKPEPEPGSLKWDLWLGPAPWRPYARGYHPLAWRGWWDFGTGALGDMACHTVNMPFMGLDLRDPASVQATTSGHHEDSYPSWSIIRFEFPASAQRPALVMWWYDGGRRPSLDLFSGGLLEEAPANDAKKGTVKTRAPGSIAGSGCLIVGEKGNMYAPGDFAEQGLRLSKGLTEPKVEYPSSPGHFEEWVRAIKGGPAAASNFSDYAGPLVETILVGNLAVWAASVPEQQGKRIEWDAKDLKATNAPEVEGIIRATYRKGYSL